MTFRVWAQAEEWPLARPFTISRGQKSAAHVVVVHVEDGVVRGRGECVPYARYGETAAGCLAAIEGAVSRLGDGLSRQTVAEVLPAGAARNAVDCALWDLEAKKQGRRAWELAGIPVPQAVVTAETVALDTPDAMAAAARRVANRPLIKVKLDGDAIAERVAAVRRAVPAARLIVDANESWTAERLAAAAPVLAELGVEMIEQPLPADADEALDGMELPVALCADESVHTATDLDRLGNRYAMVNIKLDKAGGVTEALCLSAAARRRGLDVMVGCMVATSLAMAPAILLADGARFVDLDGPLWLAQDREPSMILGDGRMAPPAPALWG